MLQRILRSLFGGGESPAATSAAKTSRDLVPGTAAYKAAQDRVVAAILALRDVVKTGTPPQIEAAIRVFRTKATADDLDAREMAAEIADAERMLAVLAYTERLGRGEDLQPMAVMSDGEPAFFQTTKANRETARGDDYGQLDIGDKGIFYAGDKRITIIWRNVLTIGVDRESLIIHPARGGKPTIFYLPSDREAQLAHSVASTIFKKQSATAPSPSPSRVKRAASATAADVTPQNAEPALTPLDLGGRQGLCNFNVVGESQYQGRLRNLSKLGPSFTALLIPEPTNAFDPNAIRVVAEGADTIAYLSREDAVHYGPIFELLAQHKRVGTCNARLTGGTGAKRSFGVMLNLPEADELLVGLRKTLKNEAAAVEDDEVQPF